MESGEDISAVAWDPPAEFADPNAQIADAEQRLSELRADAQIRAGSTMRVQLDRSVHLVLEAYQRDAPVGIPWCISEIEEVTDTRMEPGDLVGLLGASGDAKTSLVLQQVRFAAEQGTPALFLSGEQSVQQCIRQMHCQRLGLIAKFLRDGRISTDDYARVRADADAIAELPLSVETGSDMTVGQLSSIVRSFSRRYGPGLIVIDHAKKLVPDHRNDIFAQQVFQIYEGLKALASSTENAILLIMQRSSEFLKRRRMRPVRGDCFGGEGTLQNLDGCIGIFRPGRWLRERAKIEERDSVRDNLEVEAASLDRIVGLGPGRSLAEIYPLKARFGDDEGDRRRLVFEGRHTRLSSLREIELT